MPRPSLAALALPALLALGACGPTPAPSSPSAGDARQQISAMLDDWHEAAARSDESAYFAHFTPDAVFLGTDPAERWDLEAFRKYASPRFARGKGWTMKARRRDIFQNGDMAWFDEDLDSKNMGSLRASGVVVRDAKHSWRVARYDLSVPVPNDAFDGVRKLIEKEKP